MTSDERPPEQVIILAAGRASHADGVPKCLIRHPVTHKTILEHAVESFRDHRVTVVVGYRAIQVMEQFPRLHYVVNDNWADTGNALSLGLALTDDPTYVIPGDVFLSPELARDLSRAGPNLALTSTRENRIPTAINAVVSDEGALVDSYQGIVRQSTDPELLGLFKITSPLLLEGWKRRCMSHGNLFAGMTLPHDLEPIYTIDVGNHQYFEINDAWDYLRFIREACGL